MIGKVLEKLDQTDERRCVWVPVESLTPAPYDVVKPFTVVVTPAGEEYEASFYDEDYVELLREKGLLPPERL